MDHGCGFGTMQQVTNYETVIAYLQESYSSLNRQLVCFNQL